MVEPAALAAAGRSLDSCGPLLLGEMHGARENPLLIRALMQTFGLTSLAVEWLDDLAPVIQRTGVLPLLLTPLRRAACPGQGRRDQVDHGGEFPSRKGPGRAGRAPGPPVGLLVPVDHLGHARHRVPHHRHRHRHRARLPPAATRADPADPQRNRRAVRRAGHQASARRPPPAAMAGLAAAPPAPRPGLPLPAASQATMKIRAPRGTQGGRPTGVVDCLACTSLFSPSRRNRDANGGKPSAASPQAGMTSRPGKSPATTVKLTCWGGTSARLCRRLFMSGPPSPRTCARQESSTGPSATGSPSAGTQTSRQSPCSPSSRATCAGACATSI